MFWMDRSKDQGKDQGDDVPSPQGLPPEVIVSPDTRRAGRIPPGQSRTRKWPVLDASGPPEIDLAAWRFRISGLVGKEVSWDWEEFLNLPRVRVFSDFHCVTRWSRLGNLWEGVSTRELIGLAGGARPEAHYVTAYGYDRGWTTNLPLEDFLAEDALVAILHDGESIATEHGGPARLIVPQLYAWKSAKWVAGVELTGAGPARFLGEERISHARRPLEAGKVWIGKGGGYSSKSPICSLAAGLAFRLLNGLPITPSTATDRSAVRGTKIRWLLLEGSGGITVKP